MSKLIKIEDIAELNKCNYQINEYPDYLNYLDTGNLTNNLIDKLQYLTPGVDKIPSRAKRKIKINTILYSTVRPNLKHFGFFETIIENIIVSTGFTTIDIIDDRINPKFLYYLLTQNYITEYLHTIGMNSVSAYPSISPNDIGALEFKVPVLATQKSIAKVLSDLDSKIELNNKINQELESMAKTIYDYWFVQFDFPNHEGKPYKASGGKMVYNEEIKREIPEGWEVGCLSDIATYTNGLACQKFRPVDSNFLRVIKIREMRDGFSVNTEKVKLDIPEKLIVNNGDVLFSWSASLEVILWSGGIGGLNQHIFKVTSDEYPKSFYYFQLIWYLRHFKMIADLRKTTMGHITQDHLKQSRIVIPSTELIHKLDLELNPIQSKQVNLKQQNQELTSLRDWLLPMLMNGQISVSDAEARISETME